MFEKEMAVLNFDLEATYSKFKNGFFKILYNED